MMVKSGTMGGSPQRRRRRGCLLLLGGGLILLLLGGAYGYSVYEGVKPRLSSGQARLEHAVGILSIDPPTALTPAMLDDARGELVGAGADFRAVQEQAGPLLAVGANLGWVPTIGGDLSQAPALLALASDVSDLGTALVDRVAPAVARLRTTDPAPPTGDAGLAATLLPLVDALSGDTASLAHAEQALAAVKVDRARLDPTLITLPRVRTALDKLDAQLPVLEQALSSLRGLPQAVNTLLGRSRPITFLVLAQNQDELRATGGFISAVGLLTVDRGAFTRVEFQDSYAVDNPRRPILTPPTDLARYMGTGGWFIRDANWAPDFPRSARTAETFYQLDQGVAVDGTLAVDQQMVQFLLQATGPVTLAGYPDRVGADNVVRLMQHYFMPTPGDLSDEWWVHRKDFMRDLFHALAEVLHDLPREKLLALAGALQQGLDQKHLLISMHDDATATWLGSLGWDGALHPPAGDALAVVDTNMGFNKVNVSIEARLSYTLTLSADPATPHHARLAATYHNRSPPNGQPCVQEARYKDSYAALTTGCYWNYVRVYVPSGSILLGAHWGDSDPQIESSAEYSQTAFTAFVTLAPGEERTLALDYAVPYSAISAAGGTTYDLLVRKQPGTDAVPLAVAIRLAPGTILRGMVPPPVLTAEGWLRYPAIPLDRDRTIHLRW